MRRHQCQGRSSRCCRGYAKLTRQEAALVTTGVYPLSTITANLQRTADLMNVVGMIRQAAERGDDDRQVT